MLARPQNLGPTRNSDHKLLPDLSKRQMSDLVDAQFPELYLLDPINLIPIALRLVHGDQIIDVFNVERSEVR